MDSDRVKGKMKDLAGKAQEKFGEVTGNEEQEAKGAAKQVEGKVQNTFGNVKDAGRNIADDVKNAGQNIADNFRGNRSDVQPDRDNEIGNDDIEKDENAA
jgi:uncharacterized protein YjbJ (UPF0337 family)